MNNQLELWNKLNENNTLKEVQQYVKDVIEIRGFANQEIEKTMLLFLEEVGELAKSIRKNATKMSIFRLCRNNGRRRTSNDNEGLDKRNRQSFKISKKEILKDSGKISHKQAIEKANEEYEKFRIKQDQQYISTMDKMYQRYLEENKHK